MTHSQTCIWRESLVIYFICHTVYVTEVVWDARGEYEGKKEEAEKYGKSHRQGVRVMLLVDLCTDHLPRQIWKVYKSSCFLPSCVLTDSGQTTKYRVGRVTVEQRANAVNDKT